ncbi:Oidioi.mRNA.OKI2018_I69.PAR.g11682.t1.cds [Oikopleura dioica]|uniref:Coiled-coil domain-containing protein 25 n=1 Tax=Oikopleura dioica TaxID=34765 RepID=A0ABN7S364_OIKDI|nr:Oidioi.mRNA.OKI2018_I69.PAR.g11682.t1.cds [Oikopleura dioica]
MGRDKFENEALIHNGWPEDLWFHVDDLSSAHVYLRLPRGETFESVPQEVVEECASLVKANSIKGCKMSETKIVYTPWENLKKTADMVVGQIGYHNHKRCKYITVKKNNDIVKKIEKTRSEDMKPDLQAERLARDAEVLAEQKPRRKTQLRKKRPSSCNARRKDTKSHTIDSLKMIRPRRRTTTPTMIPTILCEIEDDSSFLPGSF